jgi:hypothetical protein
MIISTSIRQPKIQVSCTCRHKPVCTDADAHVCDRFPGQAVHHGTAGRQDQSQMIVLNGGSRRMAENVRAEVSQAYLYMALSLLGMPWPPGQRATLGTRLYSIRCKLQLSWDWFNLWGMRWGRFSKTNIRKLYGCGNGVIELH